MSREQSDEVRAWYHAVYSMVQFCPYGRVTTYGHIAYLLDYPQRARQVGVCLKYLPLYEASRENELPHHDRNVPWQRILNAKGGISPREAGGVQRQAAKLREEGVEVDEGRALDEWQVDLDTWGWFPKSVDLETGEVEEG